jgi:hypothetical protein
VYRAFDLLPHRSMPGLDSLVGIDKLLDMHGN